MLPPDPVVVITGSSEGFGRALAEAFLKVGAKVVTNSHEEGKLRATAEELGTDHHVADVTSREDLERLATYAIEKYGHIDVWVNNAGIQIAPSLLEDVDETKLRRLFEINFFAYFHGCQVAMGHMRQQGSGAIVNINSSAGLDGKPNLSAYVSSKFAVRGMTEGLRKETVGSGIGIYGVFPGGMRTDIYREKVPADIDEYMEVGPVAEKVVVNLVSDAPEMDLIIKRPAK